MASNVDGNLILGCVTMVGFGVEGDDLYAELWKACAGPLVDVPRRGERVFYFPQGHVEQVSVIFFHFPGKNFSMSFFLLLMEVWPFSLLVVGGVDESGAESTDSAVQSSFEDPLSCYSHSTPGMLVSDYIFLFRVQLVDEKTQEGKRK